MSVTETAPQQAAALPTSPRLARLGRRLRPAGHSRLGRRGLGGALLLWLATALGGCGGERPLPSIVVVTIDTLRADHLGCYGYFRDTSPNLDRLAAEGVLFRNAVTTMATTLPAHLSLWTSRYPAQTGVLSNGNRFRQEKSRQATVRLFAEMLADLGYTTAGFVSATPVKRYTGIDAGFEVWDEPAGKVRPANVTTRRALDWLETAPQEPFFLWVHYFDPHKPYDPPAPYDQAFTDDKKLTRFLWRRKVADPKDPELLEINNLYDGEILFTDMQVARLVGRLDGMGVLPRAALVVTSDHGEGLGQHDRIGHGEIFNEQLFVPLVIRFPDHLGLNGREVDGVVSLTDVVPTLVETLDLPLGDEDRRQFAGRSALASRPREYAFAQRVFGPKRNWGKGEKYALVGREWKYSYSTRRPDELFDMRNDFEESVNLIGVERLVASDLKRRLMTELNDYSQADGRFLVERETSEEVRKELRALGYIQ